VPVTQILKNHRIAAMALRTVYASATATLVLVLLVVVFRRFGRLNHGGDSPRRPADDRRRRWVREDLRKPYVIGCTCT
jgi:hypothetical protein